MYPNEHRPYSYEFVERCLKEPILYLVIVSCIALVSWSYHDFLSWFTLIFWLITLVSIMFYWNKIDRINQELFFKHFEIKTKRKEDKK